MFAPGTALYLSIPTTSGRRVLHPGRVIARGDESVVAEFEEPMELSTGADVNLYCEVNGRFWQRGAAVVEVLGTEPALQLSLRFTSQAVSAESRGSYRVSLAAAPVPATVQRRSEFLVVDVSPEGFAVVTTCPLAAGTMVDVDFTYRGVKVSGRARVQPVRERRDGTCRYGFLTLDSDRNIRRALEKITAIIQREHLQRLSRSA